MTHTGRYYCADGRHIPEGHDQEVCPPCLRARLIGLQREYEANVNVDLVARLREMDHRVARQRDELSRLQTPRPPSPVSADRAFDAWCMPTLERWDRRLAAVAFRAGWQAARRALSLPDDRASEPESPMSKEQTFHDGTVAGAAEERRAIVSWLLDQKAMGAFDGLSQCEYFDAVLPRDLAEAIEAGQPKGGDRDG